MDFLLPFLCGFSTLGILTVLFGKAERKEPATKYVDPRAVNITIINKVGDIEATAKRLAKSITNSGMKFEPDELCLLGELLYECGAQNSDFIKDEEECHNCGAMMQHDGLCPECGVQHTMCNCCGDKKE